MNLSIMKLLAKLPANLTILLVCSATLVVGCKKSSTPNYNVSVNVSGLIGAGLVMQLVDQVVSQEVAEPNLPIGANGSATFLNQLANGDQYAVNVYQQPGTPAQTCSIVSSNASGTISADVTIDVTCAPIEFAYLVNSTGNAITPFTIDVGTGVLTNSGAPIVTGNTPESFALSSTGRYAYAVNFTDSTISSYLGNTTTGAMIANGAPISTGTATGPTAVIVDPGNQYVYVANSSTSTVAGFAINSSGALAGTLTAMASPFSAGTAPGALATVLQSGAEYLYVTNAGSNTVSEFGIAAGGALSSIGTVATGNSPVSIAISGNFAFVVNSADATVSSYLINSGTLISTGAAVATGGTSPASIAVTPNGQFAYVVNSGSNTVAAYSVSSSGLLTSLGAVTPTGNNPVSVSVDPKGGYAYVANKSDNSVSVFPITANGTLGSPATQLFGNGPVSFVTSLN